MDQPATLAEKLTAFSRRVRLVRAWRGLALGLLLGCLAALGAMLLDRLGVFFVDWPLLVGLVFGGAVLGTAAWALRQIKIQELAASIDGRAGLKDRLTTALDTKRERSGLDDALANDASASLAALEPQAVYPVKFTRLHMAGAAALVAVGSVFVLGFTSAFASPEAKAAQKRAEQTAKRITKAADPIEERAKRLSPPVAAKQNELARDLKRTAEELRRGRLSEKQAMQKANELAQKAKELAAAQAAQSKADLETMRDKMKEAAMDQAGLEESGLEALRAEAEMSDLMSELAEKSGLSPEQAQDMNITKEQLEAMGLDGLDPQMMNMSDQARQKAMEQAEMEIAELTEAGKGRELTEAEQRRLEMLKELQKKMQLSEEARKALREMMQSKEYQELAKAMAEARKAMQEAQKQLEAGEEPSEATMEELEAQMKAAMEAMEEMAKQWNDPEAQAEMREQMKQMLEDLKNGKLTLGECMSCLGLTPGGMLSGMGSSAAHGGAFSDTGQINKLDTPEAGAGSTQATRVRGQKDETKGGGAYAEIKAPAMTGNRSSVPYSEVLPKYKKNAEQAIQKSRVPKEHEERVKKYFDSLAEGKK